MLRLQALLSLLCFLVVGAFGFVHLFQMEHEPAMQGCPFTNHQDETVCLMTALQHFEAWMHTFISTIPSLVVLSLAAIFCISYFFRFGTEDDPTDPVSRQATGLPPPLYERLFARGLLHPKIP